MKIELNFAPRQPWPHSLPPLAWEGVVYAGFNRPEVAIEMSNREANFGRALKLAYPRLGLAEIARLYSFHDRFHTEWDQVWAAYELRGSENLYATFAMLQTAPAEFCEWVDDKGLAVRDLAPLRALSDEELRQKLMVLLANYQPNKNLGAQALEWAVDLLLAGTSDVFSGQDFAQWHAWLRSRRYSRRHQQIKALEERARKLALPKEATIQVAERGDRLGFDLRVFATDPAELKQKIEAIRASID